MTSIAFNPPVRLTKYGKPRSIESILSKKIRTGLPRWYSYHGYVVPTPLLREELNLLEDKLRSEWTPPTTNGGGVHNGGDLGWITLLAERASLIHKSSFESSYRSLHKIRHEDHKGFPASWAEAFLLAGGKYLDRDTTIPTLPGNKRDALDLLTVRGQQYDPKFSEWDALDHIAPLLELCVQILQDPDRTDELVALAPLDCLRP